MPDTRITCIILVDGSRLLVEMLNRVFLKTDHLDVIQVADHNDLPSAIDKQEAEWVIASLPADEPEPDWIDAFMRRHPHVRLLTISAGGSLIKMKWVESREEDISDISLPELIHILEGDLVDS